MSYYSVNRLRFDFLTSVLVLFDCFMVPFKNSFGVEHLNTEIYEVIYLIENTITTIFIIDLILGFRRAYVDEVTGEHVMNPKLITIKYLKFYFWIDLLGCIPFDLFTNNAILRNLSLLKTVRLLRFQRLLQFMSFSTEAKARIRIIQLILTCLIIIHWCTCLFYVIVNNNYEEILLND